MCVGLIIRTLPRPFLGWVAFFSLSLLNWKSVSIIFVSPIWLTMIMNDYKWNKKPPNLIEGLTRELWYLFSSGTDETRTRDLRLDRPAF